jgi:mono/diheme cytochrome c family protein
MSSGNKQMLVASFETPEGVMAGARAMRDAGARNWETYTPFPIHGLPEAQGLPPTKLPWLILGAGLTGLFVAIVMQWWMNAVDYPFLISGKPYWSIPANIPVDFELTVLFAGLTTFFGVLVFSNLPTFHRPEWRAASMARATDDRFVIALTGNPSVLETWQDRLRELGAAEFEGVELQEEPSSVPGWLRFAIALVMVVSLVPLAVAVRARNSYSSQPRVHLIHNMDRQVSRRAQTPAKLFRDGRASRLPPEGTVAHGAALADDHKVQGQVDGAWAETLPQGMAMDFATLKRGKERFEISCSPCHGYAGYGDGMVAKRAQELGSPQWVPPTSLHADYVRAQPVGQIYDTITHGIRNMSGYGHAVAVDDRWAISAYVKALQRSQNAPLDDVPVEKRATLR